MEAESDPNVIPEFVMYAGFAILFLIAVENIIRVKIIKKFFKQ